MASRGWRFVLSLFCLWSLEGESRHNLRVDFLGLDIHFFQIISYKTLFSWYGITVFVDVDYFVAVAQISVQDSWL